MRVALGRSLKGSLLMVPTLANRTNDCLTESSAMNIRFLCVDIIRRLHNCTTVSSKEEDNLCFFLK